MELSDDSSKVNLLMFPINIHAVPKTALSKIFIWKSFHERSEISFHMNFVKLAFSRFQ